MSFKTPYSNMHELNLDWIMKAIKNLFGGTGGQYLRKKSNTQFDYEWHTITPSDIGAMPADATIVTSVAGKTGDVTLDSQDVSFDRSETYTEPSIGAELKDIEDVVQIPTNLDGSVITFNTTEELPFLKCIVDMEPVQNLNGYDHPWAGGTEKNLCDPDTISIGYYNDSGVKSESLSYRTSDLIPVSPSTAYYSSLFDNNGTRIASLVFTEWDENQNFISQSTANPIITGATTAYVRIRNFQGQQQYILDDNFKYQLEEGTHATAFSPYSNICPIYGWNEENVWIKSDYDPVSAPTKTIDFGGTCYGGSLDVIHGALKITYDNIASYAGETLTTEWISSMDVYSPGGTPTTGAQVVYKLDPPFVVTVQPTDALITIQGVNNVWCDTGNSEITIFKSLKEILNSL